MAGKESFDITTGCDLQEVDNAVNQADKELRQRFDFRAIKFEIELRRKENKILLTAPDDFRLKAIWDVLQNKLIKRGVPVKNLQLDDPKQGGNFTMRQEISLKQGIDSETARKITKFFKDNKLKKVQATIQDDQIRVLSASRDALQEVMGMLRKEDFGVELKFGNFRNA